MTSIYRTMLVWLLGSLVAVGTLTGLGTFFLVRDRAHEFFREEMRQFAHALARALPVAPSATPESHDIRAEGESQFFIQLRRIDGTLVFSSPGAPLLPSDLAQGYGSVRLSSGEWHAYALNLGDHQLTLVHPVAPVKDIATSVALRAVLPVLALIPLLVGLHFYIVRGSLAPLHRIVSALAFRNPDHLAPMAVTGVPDEIVPVVLAVNDLMSRLGSAIEAQRRFVADAAHELRTPLAALQLELDNLKDASPDKNDVGRLAPIQSRVQRAARIVTQLLQLQRSEAGSEGHSLEVVDLGALLRETVIDLWPLADRKQIDLGMSVESPVEIRGDRESLRILFANLLDNAIRYTRNAGVIDVALRRHTRSLQVEIVDNGPGIPEALLERVFDRFFRIEAGESEGSGLGLSIARAIAQRHRATIRLRNRSEGGTVAEVTFPEVVSNG